MSTLVERYAWRESVCVEDEGATCLRCGEDYGSPYGPGCFCRNIDAHALGLKGRYPLFAERNK